jgi:HlyD family secretion protein
MAWTGLAQAQAARGGTESYLQEVARQTDNPLTLQARANAAKAQYQIATAAVGLAQAQVDGLKMGATPEQVAAVESQVGISRAALDALKVQVDKFTLQAPISGLVLERPVQRTNWVRYKLGSLYRSKWMRTRSAPLRVP